MKSVIVDIRDGFAAVLSDDGCIEKIRDKDYRVGQVICLKKRKTLTKRFGIMVSTAATFILLCGAGVWANTSPYSYVSLDINPSIEFTLNRFDRVLTVKAVNDDGETALKNMELDKMKYEKIDDAFTKTLDNISKEGYFEDQAKSGMVIATSGANEQKSVKLAKKLGENAKNRVEQNGGEVIVEAVSVGLSRVEEAKKLNVTPGKLNLVQKLQETTENPDEFNTEEWLKKPVKEIMKVTKENKNQIKNEMKKSSKTRKDFKDKDAIDRSSNKTNQDIKNKEFKKHEFKNNKLEKEKD